MRSEIHLEQYKQIKSGAGNLSTIKYQKDATNELVNKSVKWAGYMFIGRQNI